MNIEVGAPAPGLFGRIKQLIWDPPAAWDAIAKEETSPGALVGGYVTPLALAMTVLGLLGALLAAGFVFDGETLIAQPAAALLRLVLAIGGVIGFARLADALAPRFGGEANAMRAMQLSAYGATGVLLGGFAMLIPAIAPYLIASGAVFSLVLTYIGLPRMLGVPEEKRIVCFWSIMAGAALAVIVLTYAMGAAMGAVRSVSHHIRFGQAEQAPVEAAAPVFVQGAVLDAAALRAFGETSRRGASTLNPEMLAGFLPPSLPGGFALSGYTLTPAAGAPQAEGVYLREQGRMVVTITHLGQRGAIDAVDGAYRALTPRQDETGYARHQMTDGRLVAENVAGAAIGYTIIGRGVAISIAGSGGVTMDDARAAVDTIGIGRMEALFHR